MKLKERMYSKTVPLPQACLAEADSPQKNTNILPHPLSVERTKTQRGLLLTFLLSLALGFWGGQAKGQICTGCTTITGMPSTTIYGCPGDIYTLTGVTLSTDYTPLSYAITPTVGVAPSAGLLLPTAATLPDINFTIPGTCTTYSISVNALSHLNEIIGGDFEAGLPVGWATDYILNCAVGTGGAGGISGDYCLASDPHDLDPGGCDFFDHTTGAVGGHMMMCNGDVAAGTRVLYNDNLILCCNTTYRLRFFARSWTHGGTPATIRVNINGVIHDIILPATCDPWMPYTIDFVTPACLGMAMNSINTVDITLAYFNNDFAIDDISLNRICSTIVPLTLCPLAPIEGPTQVCLGNNITLSDATPGGTWSSSSSNATIGSITGIVTGVSAGTATITYTITSISSTSTCFVIYPITVNPLPAAISGLASVCVGNSITLSDISGTGTWTSSNPGIATVGSLTGIVTGVSGPGSTIIDFTLTSTGCSVSTNVNVNPMPVPISGPTSLCVGSTITVSDMTPGGTWGCSSGLMLATSAYPNAVFISTGSIGVSTITYTLPPGLCSVSYPITINPIPGPIGGITSVCVGSTITLTDGSGPGTWTSLTPGIATVGSLTGIVTGVNPGSVLIDYTVAGCSRTINVNVNPLPSPILGALTVCAGSTIVLSDLTGGGIWSSATPGVATIDGTTGIVSGVSAGTTLIDYTNPLTGCFVSVTVTVNPLPGAISGLTTVCVGSSIALSDATTGGTWSSSNILIASVDATGLVTGVAAGAVTITYTLGTGCYVTTLVNVLTTPLPIALTGPTHVCVGSTILLSGGSISGTWSSSASTVASVISGGLVTGVATGTATISYTYTTVCGTTLTAPYDITVNSLPVVSIAPATQYYCSNPISFSATASSVAYGAGPYAYAWSPTTYIIGSSTAPLITCAGMGTTTVFTCIVTDANGCVAPATAEAIIPQCSGICSAAKGCGPIVSLAPGSAILLGGGASFTGLYYLDHSITITGGTATFSNAIVAVANGVVINVAATANVVIDHSHFFSNCDKGMWNGFNMLTAGATTASIVTKNESLIEDATTAIKFNLPAYSIGQLLYSSQTIFNRCNIDIYINGYNYTNNFPCKIYNTVFTSRDFNNYTDGLVLYPCVWPKVEELENGYSRTAQELLPMNIDNLLAKPTPGGPTAYNHVYCKDASYAKIGIALKDVGLLSGSSYYGFVLTGGVQPNLFDNLGIGLFAQNSNVTVLGNYFAYIQHYDNGITPNPTTNESAVYAQTGLANNNSLTVNDGSTGMYGSNTNYFYSCNNGVFATNYKYVNCQYNKMYSNHTTAGSISGADASNGIIGFNINTNYFNSLTVNNNYICNIETGIMFTLNTNTVCPNGFINNNKIIGYTTDWPAGYCTWGIYLNHAGAAYTGSVMPTYFSVSYNEVYLAYNGIFANNFGKKALSIGNNNIDMVPASYTMGLGPQFGIDYTKCDVPQLSNNCVTGHVPSYATSNVLTGYYGWSNYNALSNCNSVQNVYYGFSFSGGTNVHNWLNNYIGNSYFGYYLAGNIGSQPGSGAFPCNNYWEPTVPWNLVIGPFQTFNSNSAPPTGSKLYVRTGSGSTYDPVINSATAPGNNYRHLFPFVTLVNHTGYSYLPCYHLSSAVSWRTTSNDSTDTTDYANLPTGAKELFEQELTYIADSTDTLIPAIPTFASNWINQMAIYTATQTDSALIDSSALLAQFAALAQNSRYAWLTGIEYAIDMGSYDSAASLMAAKPDAFVNTATDSSTGIRMADSAAADGIVYNYLAYYSIYSNYLQQNMSGSDSSTLQALAGLCPDADGHVVFKARALYASVYNAIGNWRYACGGDSTGARYAKPASITGLQNYTLYPNPNDGNITLLQSIADKGELKAEILNAYGQVVEQLKFAISNSAIQLHLGRLPVGVYLLHLTDKQGKMYNLKFEIQ